MATDTRNRDARWLSADELRRLAAAEPDAGPPPPPVHRTDESPARRPLGLAVGAALLAVLVMIALVVL